jgi:hypothetical protein
VTRSLPGFKAAASAPSERRISPALRFHYRKFLLLGALWFMGQGSRRDIACLWEQRRTQFGGTTSIGFSLLGIEDVRWVRRVLSLVEGERRSVGWWRSGFLFFGLLRSLPFWDFEVWWHDLDVCMTLWLRRRWIFIRGTCLGHLSLPPLWVDGKVPLDLAWRPDSSFVDVIGAVVLYIEEAKQTSAEAP